MNGKKWYQSKTVWFNALAFVVAVASGFGYAGELPANWQEYVTVAITLINVILRTVTREPIRV